MADDQKQEPEKEIEKQPEVVATPETEEEIWFPCVKRPIEVSYREVQGEKECIKTREGEIIAYADKVYIIKGIEGEFYPISKEIFKKTYMDGKQSDILLLNKNDVYGALLLFGCAIVVGAIAIFG